MLLGPTTHVYTKARYSACPTIRYFEEDQYFYMTTLFGSVPNGTMAVRSGLPMTGSYSCCFVTMLVRSKDLVEWQSSLQGPLMGWPDWSDRVITPGSILDTHGSAKQKWIGTSLNYSDINRSDQDMVELPPGFVAQIPGERVGAGPWIYMVFGAGDQLTTGFGGAILAKAGIHEYCELQYK